MRSDARSISVIIKYMELTSPNFQNGGSIPAEFACDGRNASPELNIADVPNGAKSLVLIMDDPDASRGVTFTHWVVWNIPVGVKTISEGVVPSGVVIGQNDFGNFGYGGPCPPVGLTHHYHFKLYALGETLDLGRDIPLSVLEEKIKKHLLEEAQLIGIYPHT